MALRETQIDQHGKMIGWHAAIDGLCKYRVPFHLDSIAEQDVIDGR